MILGKCPYCKDGQIEVRKKEINGKKVELYACSNAKWYSEDGELFELTPESTCDFKIWQNSLRKYGKYLKQREVRALLEGEDVVVTFHSKKYKEKVTYQKYITLSQEYGVSVIWDIDVPKEDN
ncbi:hypothetical protein [Arcobacter sp.]|uniref:hypothetical protein n=1 Tax=Arcobacter sp. TaxID=1872629 RepID=UPI003D11FC31